MNNKELEETIVDTMRRLESNLIKCVKDISILLQLFHVENIMEE